eukprot:TRINITY_DN1879_c0_g1_i3.p1 TRINITY_DN1879_c0_g1~~TRINITY_DN1879_c0_g1_i3.p1  ORF type:complete len:144 (+),score=16.57 TRINITY_DN1879_c0_g1_i3:394-825(+)
MTFNQEKKLVALSRYLNGYPFAPVLTKLLCLFTEVTNDDKSSCIGRNNLLLCLATTSSFDEVQVGVDFVCTINSQINDRVGVQCHQGQSMLQYELRRLEGRGYTPHFQAFLFHSPGLCDVLATNTWNENHSNTYQAAPQQTRW